MTIFREENGELRPLSDDEYEAVYDNADHQWKHIGIHERSMRDATGASLGSQSVVIERCVNCFDDTLYRALPVRPSWNPD